MVLKSANNIFSYSFQNRIAFNMHIYCTESRDKASCVIANICWLPTVETYSRHGLLEPTVILHRFGALLTVG